MQIPRQNYVLGLRMMLIIVAVVLVDGATIWFAKRPLPWAFMIPATIPIWVSLFVLRPMVLQKQARAAFPKNS